MAQTLRERFEKCTSLYNELLYGYMPSYCTRKYKQVEKALSLYLLKQIDKEGRKLAQDILNLEEMLSDISDLDKYMEVRENVRG